MTHTGVLVLSGLSTNGLKAWKVDEHPANTPQWGTAFYLHLPLDPASRLLYFTLYTGVSSRPVKNFLIFLAVAICAGVTAGSLIHASPGSLHTKYDILFAPVRCSSTGTAAGRL